jgi:4-hydroxybenzoate polyprenyltransferase
VRGLLAGLAMYSLTAFGFQVNDILDYAKDRAAGVSRPIARGALSRGAAALFAVALLLMTFALSAWVGAGGGVLAATAAALMLYTPSARKLPLIKGLYVAVYASRLFTTGPRLLPLRMRGRRICFCRYSLWDARR